MKLLFENWRQFINEEIEIPAHLKRTVYRQDDDIDKAEYQEIKDAVRYFIDLANQAAPLKRYEELTGAQQKVVQAMGLWTGGYYSVLRNLDSPEERMFMTQSPTISKRKMQRMRDEEQTVPVQFADYSLKQAKRFKITTSSLDQSFKLLYIIAQLEIPDSFRRPLYRGITLDKRQFRNFISRNRPIFHGNLQSWTTEGDRAINYANPESATSNNRVAVVLEIESPLTGTPIMGVSHFAREAEILKSGSLSVTSYTQEKDQKGFPYYRIKVKEVNIPPEKTILDKIKATTKRLFTSKTKVGGGEGAEEYIAPKFASPTINLTPKYLKEDWRDTSWEANNKKVTIRELLDYLGDETVYINVLELSQQLPSLPTQGAKRVAAANLEYPIIVVMRDGQYQYVLDGNHQLQKAIYEGIESIKAKILDVSAEAETPERFKKMFGGQDETST